MTTEGADFHEPRDAVSRETVERHRAIRSLIEELEAVDWYDQRVDATDDEDLAAILAHNRDEEKEHAVMTLEWLRRRDPRLDEELRTRLFRDGDITAHDEEPSDVEAPARPADGSLPIGDLKGDDDAVPTA